MDPEITWKMKACASNLPESYMIPTWRTRRASFVFSEGSSPGCSTRVG